MRRAAVPPRRDHPGVRNRHWRPAGDGSPGRGPESAAASNALSSCARFVPTNASRMRASACRRRHRSSSSCVSKSRTRPSCRRAEALRPPDTAASSACSSAEAEARASTMCLLRATAAGGRALPRGSAAGRVAAALPRDEPVRRLPRSFMLQSHAARGWSAQPPRQWTQACRCAAKIPFP